MTRKTLVGLLVGVGLAAMAAPTLAADPGITENPFNGFYMGVHAGYGWGDSEIDYSGGYILTSSSPPSFFGGDSDDFDGGASLSSEGWLLGAQAGANFVTGSGLLLGAEVSGSWVAISGEAEFENGDAGVSVNQEIGALGLAQAKLGWANDTVAIYGLGGLAMGNVESSVKVYGSDGGPPLPLASFGDDQTVAGWTLGAGGDVMVTDNVSVGMTYNFVRFDVESEYDVNQSTTFGGGLYGYSVLGLVNADSKLDVHIVKATLNYHF